MGTKLVLVRIGTMLGVVAHLSALFTGRKAGRVLKRSITSLITPHWTGEHATTPSLSFAPAPLSVQEGQHSLLDADSILARNASNLRNASWKRLVKLTTVL